MEGGEGGRGEDWGLGLEGGWNRVEKWYALVLL